MGHEFLVAPDDPGDVADTGAFAGTKGPGDCEPSRIAECSRPCGVGLELARVGQR